MAKRHAESKAFTQARGELLAIATELRPIRRRLCAIAKRLKAAASMADVVATNDDGESFTVEDWSASVIDPAPLGGGGTTVLEAIDTLARRLARAADADRMRAEILDVNGTE